MEQEQEQPGEEEQEQEDQSSSVAQSAVAESSRCARPIASALTTAPRAKPGAPPSSAARRTDMLDSCTPRHAAAGHTRAPPASPTTSSPGPMRRLRARARPARVSAAKKRRKNVIYVNLSNCKYEVRSPPASRARCMLDRGAPRKAPARSQPPSLRLGRRRLVLL